MTFATSAALLALALASVSPDTTLATNSDGTCSGAIEIDATTEGTFTVVGDTSESGVAFEAHPTCIPGGSDTTLASNWYKFNVNTMSSKTRVSVDSCNATTYDLDFDFFTGPDCDNLDCLAYGPTETIYCWGEDFQLRSGKTTFETEETSVYLMVNPGSYPDSQNGPYTLTVTVEHLEIAAGPTGSPTNPPTSSDCSDIPECGFTGNGSPKVPMCWTTNNGNTRTRCKRLNQVSNSRFLGCGCCPDGSEPNPPSYCTYRNN